MLAVDEAPLSAGGVSAEPNIELGWIWWALGLELLVLWCFVSLDKTKLEFIEIQSPQVFELPG